MLRTTQAFDLDNARSSANNLSSESVPLLPEEAMPRPVHSAQCCTPPATSRRTL